MPEEVCATNSRRDLCSILNTRKKKRLRMGGGRDESSNRPLTMCIASVGGKAISKLTPNPLWFGSAPGMLTFSGIKRPVRYSIERVTARPSVLVAADWLKRR